LEPLILGASGRPGDDGLRLLRVVDLTHMMIREDLGRGSG
jgi:hypothetical protein